MTALIRTNISVQELTVQARRLTRSS
nr:hypothetical protein [Rhizobium leguminosarum]